MTYSYRADGAKIKKTHHYFAGRSRADAFGITEYIDGFQYNNEEFGLTGERLLNSFLLRKAILIIRIIVIFTITMII